MKILTTGHGHISIPLNLQRSLRGSLDGMVGQEALGLASSDGSRMFVLGGVDYGNSKAAMYTVFEYSPEESDEGKWRQLDDLTVHVRGSCGFII